MNQDKPLNNQYYRSLTRKLILTVIVVSLAPMILVSGVIFQQYRESYKEKVYAHLGVLIKKHQRMINSFLSENLNDIRFLSKMSNFTELSDESVLVRSPIP